MESEWARFFVLAGIPDGTAAKYASQFAKQRMKKEMVPDLDKATLVELGVTTIGDQMAILKRCRAVAAMEKVGSGAAAAPSGQRREVSATSSSTVIRRAPITAPPSSIDNRFTALDDRCASVQRKGKPPPDRHEIYHVKMPVGNTIKSKKILQNLEALKRSGLHSRGTSGVRKAGQTVLSIAEQRERDMEVSSTTGGRPLDRLTGGRVVTGRVIKKRIGGPSSHSSTGLFSVAMAAAGTGGMKKRVRVERIEGAAGRLPSVTLQMGNRVGRVVAAGGGERKQQTIVTSGGQQKRRGGLMGRVQGGRGGQRVVVEYEDEMEEEMEEDLYEEEEEEGVEYVDEEEMEEYEDEMEEDSTVIVGASSSSQNRVETRFIPSHRGGRGGQQRGGGRGRQMGHNGDRRGPVVQQRSSIFDRIAF